MEIVGGRWPGQFDVLVDDRKVLSRKGGIFARLLRTPWPEAEEVVAAVREATPPASG